MSERRRQPTSSAYVYRFCATVKSPPRQPNRTYHIPTTTRGCPTCITMSVTNMDACSLIDPITLIPCPCGFDLPPFDCISTFQCRDSLAGDTSSRYHSRHFSWTPRRERQGFSPLMEAWASRSSLKFLVPSLRTCLAKIIRLLGHGDGKRESYQRQYVES